MLLDCALFFEDFDWNNVFDAWVHFRSVTGGITAPPKISASWTNHYCSCPQWEIQHYKSIIPQLSLVYETLYRMFSKYGNCRHLLKIRNKLKMGCLCT